MKLSLFTHAHSSPLSLATGYINVAQTILVILAVAGFFPDIPYIFLKIWLLPLNLIILRFIQIAAHINFLVLSSNPLNGYTTVCLSPYLLMDIWTMFYFGLPQIKLLWTSVYESFGTNEIEKWNAFIFLGYTPNCGMAGTYSSFEETAKLISKVAVPRYIPTNSMRIPVAPQPC